MKSAKEKPVVLVTKESFERGKQIYNSADDLIIEKAPVEEKLLAEMIKRKKPFAVVIGPESYSGPLYEAMPKGSVIARYGAGYDGVNLEKAKQTGLIVTNTPGILEASVAEHTIFLAGEILRTPGLMTNLMRNKNWNPITGTELQGKIWAIIGLGNIGKKVSRILSFGFGVRVCALKKNISDSDRLKEKYGVEKISSDYSEVVSHADIVSLHLPANEQTHHFMNRERLENLQDGAILINTARGSVVDENALFDALKSKHLSGAGLDVFENEPYRPVQKEKDLRKLPNVVLTPHIGSNTTACSKRMAERVLKNIRFARDRKHDQMDIVPQ